MTVVDASDDFADLPLVRYPMQPFQRRALALRHNFTDYDAFYVALAESLGMPLLTDDKKYAGAAGHTPPASRRGIDCRSNCRPFV